MKRSNGLTMVKTSSDCLIYVLCMNNNEIFIKVNQCQDGYSHLQTC